MSEPTPTITSTPEFYRPVEVFVARPPRRRTWLYVLFFVLTVLTTLVVGARMEFNFLHNQTAFAVGNDDSVFWFFPLPRALRDPTYLLLGVPFSATLMLILFAHEMGHYLYCRYYGVNATLPFFVPFPSLFGTMGAFIRIKSPIRSRSALFDIGIAGPIAGFVFACTALAIGLTLSKPALVLPTSSEYEFGYPLIFHILGRLVHGASHLPLRATNLHPVAIAAWVGMFATALNLLPGGQLDGGHIVFSVSPRFHRIVSTLTIVVLIPLAIYYWDGWLLWAVLLRLSGLRHPIVPEWPGITKGRRWVGAFGLIMLILTFTPTPIAHNSLSELFRELGIWH
ncbi:MAG TPA: site-2 protease family protein [Terriglobales bacterium]|nr:site-2 protease family protein [Terriglobales bacterium]